MRHEATIGHRQRGWRTALGLLVLIALAMSFCGGRADAQEDPGSLTVVGQDGHDVTLVASPPPALARSELPSSALEVIESFEPRPAQIRRLEGPEVVLVIDTSVNARTLSAVTSALAEFVLSLPSDATVGVVAAANEPVVLAPTGGLAAAVDVLSVIRRSEGRSILGGLDLAVRQFRGGENTSRAIVLVNGSGYHGTSGALEETVEAVKDSRAQLYRFELRQALLGISPPPSTISFGGRVQSLTSARDLSPALGRLSDELGNQYRIVTRFTGSGTVNVGVRFRHDGVRTTAFTILDLPAPLPAPVPSDEAGATGDAVRRAGAVVGLVVLVALLVLVPPRWARARAARASTPPSPVPALAPGAGSLATGAEQGGGAGSVGRRRRSVFVDARRRHRSRTGRGASGLGGEQVEGLAAVTELLRRRRRRTRDLWLADDLAAATREELVTLAEAAQVPVLHLPPGAVANEARSPDAEGVLAHAAALPVVRLERLWHAPASRPPVLLGVDGPVGGKDLGVVLWIAARAGVSGVVLRRGRTRVITPTVANAAAGAVERLDLAIVGGMVSAVAAMRAGGLTVVGLDSAAPPLGDLPPRHLTELSTRPLALLFGANGSLDRGVANRCDLRASVTPAGAPFDLPAAVEATLLTLFESSARSTRL